MNDISLPDFPAHRRQSWMVIASEAPDLPAEQLRDPREIGNFLGEEVQYYLTRPTEHGALRQACHGVADAARRLIAHNAPEIPAMICVTTAKAAWSGHDYYHPLTKQVATEEEAEQTALGLADHVIALPGDPGSTRKATGIYAQFCENAALADKTLWLVGTESYEQLYENAAAACTKGDNFKRAFSQLRLVETVEDFKKHATPVVRL